MKNAPSPARFSATPLLPVLAVLLFASHAASSAPTAQSADFSYILTTQNDPARPGEPVPFAVTVTNITSSTKTVQLSFVMPNHLSLGNYDPGSTYYFSTTSIAAGASGTIRFAPTIASGGSAPANGTMIELVMRDLARAITFSRSIEVQSAREEELKLSTSEGTVAPGKDFIYTLAYHNGRPSPISGAKLRLPIPTGANFVSAEGGGAVSAGSVMWSLGTLVAGDAGRVQVRFTAPSTAGPALLLDAQFLDAANQVLAQASDAKVVESSPVFAYSISTQNDPVAPGETMPLAFTVTNLTNSVQNAQISLEIPNYASIGNYDPGDIYWFSTVNVAAGATQTIRTGPTIMSGASAPPDGSVINFVARDTARGVSVSRTVVVQSSPSADLKISTSEGTVAPGKNFTYDLAYHNSSPAIISGAKLQLPVPTGATFVSADGGGTVSGGIVQWSLGNLAVAKTGHVQATFTAPSSPPPRLLIDAKLRDSAGKLLAHASDVKTVESFPTFAYSISTQHDTATPGERVPLAITLTNLTNSDQTASIRLEVPKFSSIGNFNPGELYSFSSVNVATGASTTISVAPEIDSGTNTPPDGTIVNFVVRDFDRGATVSRSIVTQSSPVMDLKLSTPGGTVASGKSFSYSLAYQNRSAATVTGTTLTLAVPPGATFSSADGGGKLVNGVVRWVLGSTAAGATAKVQAKFTAPSTSNAALLMDARLLDASNNLLARASDVKTIRDFPTFSYELTAQVATASPGEMVPYLLQLTNLTNSTQTSRISVRVPRHSYIGNYDPGDSYTFSTVSVASKASTSIPINLSIPDGANAPADGSIINLVVQDLDRAASVSHTMAVNRTIYTYGTIIRTIELGGNLNFGKVLLGQSKTQVLTIGNRGTSPLTVSSITLPGGFTGSFAGAIPVDGVRNVSVTFKPTAGRAYSGSLTVNSNKTGGNNTMTVTGTGASRILKLGGDLKFGNVNVGTKKTAVLKISNQGNEPLTISRIVLPKGFSGSFAGTISPGATKKVMVKFRPKEGRKYSGKLRIISDKTSGGDTKTLAGFGVSRILKLGGNLNFGKVTVGSKKSKILTIANKGNKPLKVKKIVLPKGFKGSFKGSIKPGAKKKVRVTFMPKSKKALAGKVTVVSNKTSGSKKRGVSGKGVVPK